MIDTAGRDFMNNHDNILGSVCIKIFSRATSIQQVNNAMQPVKSGWNLLDASNVRTAMQLVCTSLS